MKVLKPLTPYEEFVFRAACNGVGTFRVRSYKEELEALRRALDDMEPERAAKAVEEGRP